MTLDQTRKLGIEFERRLQTINENMKISDKIDTDDIYSYLNQYQDQFIKTIYLTQDNVKQGTKALAKLQDYLKTLVKEQSYSYSESVVLPDNYLMYLSSNSVVTVSYLTNNNSFIIDNTIIKQSDAYKFKAEGFNKGRVLQHPIVYLTDNTLHLIKDEYTTPTLITLQYVSKPNYFDINTNTACELPYECFEDIVNGAVDLYFEYKYKINLAKQQPKQQNQQQEDSE